MPPPNSRLAQLLRHQQSQSLPGTKNKQSGRQGPSGQKLRYAYSSANAVDNGAIAPLFYHVDDDDDEDEEDDDVANVRLLAGDDAMAIISRAPSVNIILLLLSYTVDMQRRRRVECCRHVEDKVEELSAVETIITSLFDGIDY